MEFKFDSQQQYQLDAISAVVDLFEGQPADAGAMEAKLQIDFFSKAEDQTALYIVDEVGAVGNNLLLDPFLCHQFAGIVASTMIRK